MLNLYVDGSLQDTESSTFSGFSSASQFAYYLGTGYLSGSGSLPTGTTTTVIWTRSGFDSVRSADWIAAEFANQKSSSTFFTISGENAAPDAVRLIETPTSGIIFPSQTEQLTAYVSGACNTAVTWSINPLGTGSVSSSGVYTAPSTIATPQTVTITATSAADPTVTAAATFTLSRRFHYRSLPPRQRSSDPKVNSSWRVC